MLPVHVFEIWNKFKKKKKRKGHGHFQMQNVLPYFTVVMVSWTSLLTITPCQCILLGTTIFTEELAICYLFIYTVEPQFSKA